MSITLAQAEALIAGVLDEARRRELPPLSVAVLDAGARLKALKREDGCSFLRADVCQAKAFAALGMGVDTRELARRYSDDLLQQGFFTALSAMTAGRLVALPGGLLVRTADGVVLGAVGVAGGPSEADEACARAGIEAAGLRASRCD